METEFDFEDRIMSNEYDPNEDGQEISLRPKTLDEYVGQDKAKENLKVYIESAKMRGTALDHVLLYGPPGLGKTTLAGVIANEMGKPIRITSGPAIEKVGDLVALLTNMNAGDILFIDEIHRLSRQVEEVLYPAMEDYAVDIIIGKGPSARSIRLDLKPFTLIGATTRAGQMTTPLRDRFGVILKLEIYTPDELATIVRRSAKLRIANRLLKRIRDFAIVKGNGVITGEIAEMGLRMLDIDAIGLDAVDRRMMEAIIKFYAGGPVGLETLAATIGEEAVTIEDVYEPYLMQLGFLSRTPRGRCVTKLAYDHLGIPFAPGGQPSFFDRKD